MVSLGPLLDGFLTLWEQFVAELSTKWDGFLAFPASLCFCLLWLTRHMGTFSSTPFLISWPGGMREAIRRPGLPGVACWIVIAVCFCCLFACLGLSVPVFLVLAVLVPLLKSSPPGPTFRQAMRLNALGPPFFRIFFWTSFFIDFVSVFASILPPKIDPKPENFGKKWCSNPTLLSNRFFDGFWLALGRAEPSKIIALLQ